MIGETIAAIVSGAAVGFTLGLVGGGGSVLATPLLLYVVGVRDAHVALGTGAIAVSLNAFANLFAHARAKNVWWRCAAIFAGIGAIGSLGGSSLGKLVDGQKLLFLFGLVMLLAGALMLRPRKPADGPPRAVDGRMCAMTAAVALLTGAASGFFGIGGGFLIVPAMILATGMPTINAVGSSLFAVGVFGMATALNYAISGLVDWPIAGLFIAGGAGGGVLGALLAGRLSSNRNALGRILAVVIITVAFYVLARSGAAIFHHAS
ncbi:MAG: sulfite exporter TauE/SafE family protein [Hyphomicrobiales bacterium]|nr:sulfite exporter TauE/SafE family protein [Hyphomicrobiales bacterium]